LFDDVEENKGSNADKDEPEPNSEPDAENQPTDDKKPAVKTVQPMKVTANGRAKYIGRNFMKYINNKMDAKQNERYLKSLQCPGHGEKHVKGRIPEMTCQKRNLISDKSGVPPEFIRPTIKEGCFCRAGFVRDEDTGLCISNIECNSKKMTMDNFDHKALTCDLTSQIYTWKNTYEKSCDEKWQTGIQRRSTNEYKTDCFCTHGYVRESSDPGARFGMELFKFKSFNLSCIHRI